MKRIKVSLDDITEFDLNLAKNEQAVSFTASIVKLSLEDRAQRLKNLQQKIQDGEANLFEEKVLAKLLENRTAERIRVIHKNLPRIEEELKKRNQLQDSSVKRPPAASSPSRTERSDAYRSELLDFLASQKPPSPPSLKNVSDTKRSGVIASSKPEKQPTRYVKDIFVGISLVLILVLGFWYTLSSEEIPPTLATFDQQVAAGSAESGLSKETLQNIRTQFDKALQELRLGEFELGRTQLLDLIQTYPNTSQAEEAYIAIADTYRQRQDDPDEALKYYQTFTEEYPNSSRVGLVLLKMGFSYEDMEDTGSAEKMYRLVLKRHGRKSRLGQLAKERFQSLEDR